MPAKMELRLNIRDDLIAPEERGLYRRAWLLLTLLAPGLRLLGMERCYHALDWSNRITPKPTTPAESLQQARHMGYLVRVAAERCPFQADCLERSLTLWYLLQRVGIASYVRLGSCFGGDGLAAHAWVELHGEVVSERLDPRFRYCAFDWSLTEPKPRQKMVVS